MFNGVNVRFVERRSRSTVPVAQIRDCHAKIAPADERENGGAAEQGVERAAVPGLVRVAEMEHHHHEDRDPSEDIDPRVAFWGWGQAIDGVEGGMMGVRVVQIFAR